jgi:hypothetical protein
MSSSKRTGAITFRGVVEELLGRGAIANSLPEAGRPVVEAATGEHTIDICNDDGGRRGLYWHPLPRLVSRRCAFDPSAN